MLEYLVMIYVESGELPVAELPEVVRICVNLND